MMSPNADALQVETEPSFAEPPSHLWNISNSQQFHNHATEWRESGRLTSGN